MRSHTIDINHLSFRYGSHTILSDIGLTFERGGFYLLIGPNGGGKTTLLKLLMSLLSPTSGSISLFGKSPFEMRSKIGYVPQSYQFDPKFPLTVYEFVLMGALSKLTWYGTYPKKIKTKALQLLEHFEISDLKEVQIGKLSGGQKQRAALARALLDDPEIILLDEPTTGLDPGASSLIQKHLASLKGKKTILMVTHTLPDFLEIVDKIVCIQTRAEIIRKETICSHHLIGVYHNLPLREKESIL